MAYECSHSDPGRVDADVTEIRESVDVDEQRGGCKTHRQERYETLSAREHLRVRITRESVQRIVE